MDPLDGLTSLREALTQAADPITNPGDDIIVLPREIVGEGVNGSYSLQLGQLSIDDPTGLVRIESSGGPAMIIGDGSSRVLAVATGSRVELAGLVLYFGAADDGAGISNRGTLTLSGAGVNYCTAANSGGGIANYGTLAIEGGFLSYNHAAYYGGGLVNYGALTITPGSNINQNSTSYLGGGLANFGGTVSITGASVSNNSGGDGGGIANFIGTVTVNGSYLMQNSALSSGAVSNRDRLTILDSRIEGNTSQSFGGALTNTGTAEISGTTFRDNTATGDGGAVENAGGTLTIDDSTLDGNASTGGDGGAVHNTSGGTLEITGGTLSNNTAAGDGGAVFQGRFDSGNTLTITGGTLSGNAADQGGALYNHGGSATLTDTAVLDNAASDGGGLYNLAAGTLTVDGGEIRGNTASRYGGGLYNQDVSTVHLTNAPLLRNAASNGGGLYNSLGTVMIDGSDVGENAAVALGGGLSNAGHLSIVASTIRDNAVGDGSLVYVYGGGLFNDNGGVVTIDRSTLRGNVAIPAPGGLAGGGGLANNYGTTATISHSTLSGNSATAGGAVWNSFGGSIRIDTSTLSGNTADRSGGGIHNVAGDVVLTAVTITGNAADEGEGGGLWSDPSTPGGLIQLGNSIVARNLAATGGADLFGSFLSQGYNLIGVVDASSTGMGAAGDLVGAIGSPIDPLLGPLQDNGGPTLTHALLSGSPALDAGDPALAATDDQRGIARPQGARADIGAFELEVVADTTATPPALSVQDASGLEDLAIPLTIVAAMGDPDGSETLALTVAGVPEGATLSAGTFDGVLWHLNAADLDGLTITTSGASPVGPEFTLTVVATATETNGGDTASTTGTLRIAVTAVNDPPTFASADSVEVSEGSGPYSGPWATSLDAGGPDESGQALAFLVLGNSDPGLFTVQPSISASGILTFTPAGASGTAWIEVVLVDDGGTSNGGSDRSSTVTFPIDILNVAPTASISGPSGGLAGQVLSLTLTTSDPSAADGVAGFDYVVDWGDGSDPTIVERTPGNGAGVSVDHAYASGGSYTVRASATDIDGASGPEALLGLTVANVTPAGLQGVVDGAGTTGGEVLLQPSTGAALAALIDAVNALAPPASGPVTVRIDLGGGTYQADTTIDAPSGVTVLIENGTLIGGSPALIVSGGTVILDGVLATNATAAPTILVTGGHLTIRRSMIEESTGSAQAALRIDGGTVDLGTDAEPGGNTINVNGAGELVENMSGQAVAAVGTAFRIDGAPLTPSSLSGFVFEDFNDDGEIDFGEMGIAGVPIILDGTDFLGNSVHRSQATDVDGAYIFGDLLPGTYRLNEVQPAGYRQGIDSLGTVAGAITGVLSGIDQFELHLGLGRDALNYNYGERPAATAAVVAGQAAGIGFWHNKNGQALIKALNGGTGHQLGDWLAATFPHLFGALAGSNNLAGKSNAFIAVLFLSNFNEHGQKLDAQVLATALAVYVTDPTLDSDRVGARYGFLVGGHGLATSTYKVGSGGAAFGVANNTTMTILDILMAADAQAVNGVLYNGDRTRRDQANTVFSAINEAGGL